MNLPNMKLPSNRKFGVFFTAIFVIVAGYSYYVNSFLWFSILGAFGLAFFIATIVRAEVLLPFNKMWMRFGLLLGMIVSPIVMGVIFFGIFTPISILMRLFGRDELRLRFNKKKMTHWVEREVSKELDAFENQF